jgi:hypothetical protein
MSTFTKTLFIIEAILTLIGSFLPWRREGDVVLYLTYGINIFPAIKDNGGLLIVFLTVILVILIFRPPDFIEKPITWSIFLSLALVFDSIFQIGKLFIDHANAIGVVGAPMIQIGLVMVSTGSFLLFFTIVRCALAHHQIISTCIGRMRQS